MRNVRVYEALAGVTSIVLGAVSLSRGVSNTIDLLGWGLVVAGLGLLFASLPEG